MRYWVFYDVMLARALDAYEAERRLVAGVTEQQAKDETQAILAFLGSHAAVNCGLLNDDGRKT